MSGKPLRQQIVAEIMTLVRQRPRKIEPRPTIDELEKILNSETSDEVHIEPDGSVSVRPATTTVGAVADKVAALVEGESDRLRTAVDELLGLVRRAQEKLCAYLHPDSGIDDRECMNSLLEMFDGPEQRRIEALARSALASGRAP